jgi:insertion element IS1 protein InsB
LKHLNAHFYTDEWEAYQKILPNESLTMSKKNTIGIEQNNSNVRHFPARMTRRTKVVSKSATMVDLTLRLCWYLTGDEWFKAFKEKIGVLSF